jgi:phage shock protein C
MGYSNSRNAIVRQDRKLLGVCAAIANSLGVQAIWVRISTIALTLFVTGWVIPIYLVAGWGLSRARKNHQASRSTRSRYLGSESSRYLSETDRLIGHRDSALAREIDALR